jgi:ABC-type sugar transport system substrate-binding protein
LTPNRRLELSMQRFKLSALFGLGVLAFACGGDDPEPKPTVKIAWISKSRCNSFFDLSRFGARLAGRDLSAHADHSVDVALLEPEDECGATVGAEACASARSQMALVDQAIEQKYDAVAISVNNPSAWRRTWIVQSKRGSR